MVGNMRSMGPQYTEVAQEIFPTLSESNTLARVVRGGYRHSSNWCVVHVPPLE
jgi:hypothetical protein